MPGFSPTWLAAALAVFVIAEVNYPHLQPQSQLAIFAALGFVLCFGAIPAHPSLAGKRWARATDILLALLSAACCLYVVVQTESAFESLWMGGRPLVERAGGETTLDLRPAASLTDRARDLLGWEPSVPFRAGLERTVDWFRHEVG